MGVCTRGNGCHHRVSVVYIKISTRLGGLGSEIDGRERGREREEEHDDCQDERERERERERMFVMHGLSGEYSDALLTSRGLMLLFE